MPVCGWLRFNDLIHAVHRHDGVPRDYLADQMTGMPVASYSGAGGAWRDASGHGCHAPKRRSNAGSGIDRCDCWCVRTPRAKDEPSVRGRAGELRSAVEPDENRAADRAYRPSRAAAPGDPSPELRLQDTVEQDVFFSVGNRIIFFKESSGVSSQFCPRLPRKLEELALLDRISGKRRVKDSLPIWNSKLGMRMGGRRYRFHC